MYNPNAYDSLPSLRTAAARVDERVHNLLNGPIRQYFLEHAAHEEYGIALLHKHFPISDTERLVDYSHSSTAWKVDQKMDVVPVYQGQIVPRSYRLYKGTTVAYEFAYSEAGNGSAPLPDFQTGALGMLKQLGLDEIFGLRHLDWHDPSRTIEITEGKTNIMIGRGAVPPNELIEALWIFGTDENDRCHCREHCWPTKEGHDKDHSCG
ncbi:hypothetical protein EJ07DRAFT_136915 [Lizonia empirigonia]|nr:hypothetical protein EJ07DRAFT_136915 [Lizonia empirigonia]